ncbi:MAG: hypothetical protein ABIJ52_04145 [Pseudomonadota bacterium]
MNLCTTHIHRGYAEDAPGRSTKSIQAKTINGFVGINPLGLHRFNGCPPQRTGYEGFVQINTDCMRTNIPI